MLNEADFSEWCRRLALTDAAQAVISGVRSRNPTRRVGGGRENVSGRYPSRKMGFTIQFESHKVELPFVYEVEHDPDVLEYYDQPPSIPLAYRAANGRHLSVMHTPDYFVLRHDSAVWVECKTPKDLEKLAIRSPNRYILDGDGSWRCPPGEAGRKSWLFTGIIPICLPELWPSKTRFAAGSIIAAARSTDPSGGGQQKDLAETGHGVHSTNRASKRVLSGKGGYA